MNNEIIFKWNKISNIEYDVSEKEKWLAKI